jgi:ATP-dependent exoDNAse (exonuclease V) beta subunit
MSGEFRHTVIRASAGTGKTYQLTNRFLKLLCEGVPPQRILATTFTRKAAGEIFDRILLRLAQAATSEKERKKLAAALEEPGLSHQRCLDLLVDTVHHMHCLRIGTLDSFFVQIAGSFALELGLPLGWRIAESLEDQALRQEAVAAVLARGKSQDLLALFHLLTKGEVRRSVVSLVLGVAQDMYDLCRETQEPAWQHLPRHSGLAADELAAAIEALRQVPLPAGKQWQSGHAAGLAAAEATDWQTFLGKGLASKVLCGELTYYKKEIPPDVVAAYQRLIDHARSVLITQLAKQTEATWQLLAQFATEYEQLKDQRRALRFDDITWRLARRLDEETIERLAFRLDSGISHLLLDEFQDTSLAQWQVLRPLAEKITAAASGGHEERSFFCVGDVKQAIYGWRGGLAEIFDALDVSIQGLERSDLAKSYRSSQSVIDTVNAVFSGLTRHPNLERLEAPVRAWQEAFPEHSTDKVDLPGYVSLQVSPRPKEDEDRDDTHYEFAAAEVARLAEQSPGRSFGVLVRTNLAVARMIYLLRKHNVPASEEGGNPLIDSPAVELLLSLLRIADHPGDTVARFHVAASPLGELVDYRDHRDAIAAARLSHALRERLLEQGYGATLFHYAGLLAPICDERDRSRLTQLVELAWQYQADSTLRTDDFIDLVETNRVADPSSAAVRVMTIHQAKGLEFDIVVLPELGARLAGQPKPFVAGRPQPAASIDVVCRYCDESVRQLLPDKIQSLFDAATGQAVSESLCLLYVALTRAIHALHMIVAPNENEKSLPKTYAGLLRAALTDGSPLADAKVVYECGDARWYKKAPAPVVAAAEPACPVAPIALAPAADVRHRGLDRTSPSRLEGGRQISLDAILSPPDPRAFEYGTLIHAWLEQVNWLDDGVPDEAQLRAVAAGLAAEIGTLAGDLDGPLAALDQMLKSPDIRRVLSRAYYQSPSSLGLTGAAAQDWPTAIELEVLCEHPFVIRDGDRLLSGNIDRLVLVRSKGKLLAADVIDFKTDVIPPGDEAALAAKVDYYRPQLAAYCRAVQQLFALPPQRVTSRLAFVSAGKVIAVDSCP